LLKSGRLLMISTVLFEAWFISLINQQIYLAGDINDLKVFLPIINLVVLALSVLVIISIKGFEENTKKLTELNLLKAHLLQVEDMLSALHAQKHEHSRHIQTLAAFLVFVAHTGVSPNCWYITYEPDIPESLKQGY